MRTVVIGDIHGCYHKLKSMLDHLLSEGKYTPGTDRLIFLGDYVDRGENPREVVRMVRNLQENYGNVIALMGNHEDMMIDYYYEKGYTWDLNGGEITRQSYIDHDDELRDDLDWMENLPLYFEDDNFSYVQAGVDVTKPLNEQYRDDLLWIRDEFLWSTKRYTKTIIFGHTPTQYCTGKTLPFYTPAGHIGIDTGCVYSGVLTALFIEDGRVQDYYQTKKSD